MTDNLVQETGHLEQTQNFLKPFLPFRSILGIEIICTNIFIVAHFRHQHQNFVACMYLLLAFCDISMVLCMYAQSTILGFFIYPADKDLTPATAWAVLSVSILMGVFFRVSIFVNVVFSFARTLKVLRPFSSIRVFWVEMSVLVCGIFWLSIGIIDMALIDISAQDELDRYLQRGQIGDEIAAVYGLPEPSNSASNAIRSVFFCLANLMPANLCGLCFIFLYCSSRNKSSAITDTSARNMRHVTVTVTMLTFLFDVCIGWPCAYFFCEMFIRDMDSNVKKYGHGIFFIILPLVNASVSPVIIILRSKELREKFLSFVPCYKTGMRAQANQVRATKHDNETTKTRMGLGGAHL